MKYGLLVLLCVIVLPTPAQADGIDKPKLRHAVRLPLVSAFGGVRFSSTGFSMPGDKRDVPAEIAVLLKELKGDVRDAATHLRLSELYALAGDQKRGDEAAAKAVDQCRQQLKDAPKDGATLALLGEALAAAGQHDEAEKSLREAVQTAPKDWRLVLALAKIINSKAIRVLLDGFDAKNIPTRREVLLTLAAKGKIAADKAAQTEKLLEEARAALDKAVDLAEGKEWQPYAERAWSRALRSEVLPAAEHAQGRKVALLAPPLSPEIVADLKEVARLQPKDPRALGLAIITECLLCVYQGKAPPPQPGTDVLWKGLPDDTRKRCETALTQLTALSEPKNSATARRAAEIVAVVNLFLRGDLQAAETHLRRVIAEEPERDQAWLLLMGTCVAAKDDVKHIEVGTSLVKRADTGFNRFLLAKAYERAGQLDKAEEALRPALKLDPKYPLALVGLAALLLKKDDDAALKEAVKLIIESKLLLIQQSEEDNVKHAIVAAIELGLRGEPAKARRLIREVLERDARNDHARAVLAALGE